MTDTLEPSKRSEIMRRVRSKNTKPEMIVRRMVYAMGFRYRIHGANLPGRPDLVFAGREKVIFVHGCFWHQHPSPNCKGARVPKSRQEFWLSKFEKNVARDLKNQSELIYMGWEALVIWECELKDLYALREKISAFLDT